MISCSNESNSGIEKNSPNVILKPSQSFLIVIAPGFCLSSFKMLLTVTWGKANDELNELIAGAQNLRDEYHRILSWADLYDKCSFDAKKMIVCQFIKAVHVGRGYQLSVDLNVSFEALRSFSMQEPIPVVPTVLPTAI